MKEYFSHDYNARSNEKILELRAEFGAEGYGIFWMIIESIAESTTSSLDIKNIAGLSLSYGIAKDKLIILIDKMIELKLLIKKETFIFSDRINDHKLFRTERSKSGKIGAAIRWKSKLKNGSAIAQPMAIKVKYSKEKEIKLKKEDKEKSKRKTFTPPNINQVSEYMNLYSSEKNIQIDLINEPEKFMKHYESVGWMIGKNKMKSWEATVCKWILRGNEFKKGNKNKNEGKVASDWNKIKDL